MLVKHRVQRDDDHDDGGGTDGDGFDDDSGSPVQVWGAFLGPSLVVYRSLGLP